MDCCIGGMVLVIGFGVEVIIGVISKGGRIVDGVLINVGSVTVGIMAVSLKFIAQPDRINRTNIFKIYV